MTSRNTLLATLGLAALGGIALALSLMLPRSDAPSAPGAPAGVAPLTPATLPPAPPSPIESFRALTHADADRFDEERLEEALAPRVAALAEVIRGGDGTGVVADRLLAATPLSSLELRALIDRPGIRVFAAGPPPASRSLDGETFVSSLRNRLALVETLARCELKVIGITRSSDGGVTARTLCRFAGDDSSGGRHQWNATFDFLWAGAPAPLLQGATLVDWSGGSFARAAFSDVSEAALGANSCWDAQLRPSVDYFRDRLDTAIGMDVYGHHGIAAGDLDGDGLDDLYVPEPAGLPNRLLRSVGDGRFEDVSAGSGADLLDASSQALIFDADNDGDRDIFIAGGDALLLLRNRGAGEGGPGRPPFEIEPLSVNLTRDASALGAVAADYDGDGAIDVYVTCYTFWRNAAGGRTRFPLPYHEARNGARNVLLRNLGDGRFEDVTAATGLDVENSRFTFAAAWGDYDTDGRPDLYVANDFGSNQLFRNAGDGRFEDVTASAGVADIGPGMSAAWSDIDDDGQLDLYVGNMFSSAGRRVTGAPDYKRHAPALRRIYRRHARGNSLFRNAGGGRFHDISVQSGTHFGRWAWASDFVDADLDGRDDIYVANGFVTGVETHDL